MKHKKHEQRLSFRKWGLPGQRVQTQDSENLKHRLTRAEWLGKPPTYLANIGKNNGPLRQDFSSQNLSTQFQLHKHNCVNDPMGIGASVVESYDYQPQRKAPSRRDIRRERARANHN